MAFLSQTLTNLNTNLVGDKTSSIDVTGQTVITWRVISKTGSHDNHRIGLRGSLDNTTFFPMNSRLEGADVMSVENNFAVGYIKFRVSTAEGSISTVDIGVNAK